MRTIFSFEKEKNIFPNLKIRLECFKLFQCKKKRTSMQIEILILISMQTEMLIPISMQIKNLIPLSMQTQKLIALSMQNCEFQCKFKIFNFNAKLYPL